MTACPSAAGGTVKRKVPLYCRKPVFPFFSSTLNIPSICSLQKLSREMPIHTAAPPTESAENTTTDEDKKAALCEQLKIASAASNYEAKLTSPSDDSSEEPKTMSTNDDLKEQTQVTSSEKNEIDFYYGMICQFEYTPLKPIADDLVLLHTDLLPSEIYPTLNRSPSFIVVPNKDDGLLYGRGSPKLDIPFDRYGSHMVDQHPLAMYSLKMEKPVIEKDCAECSCEDYKGGVTAEVQAKIVELADDHPAVSGVEESSKTSVNQDTEQIIECIGTMSGVEESSSVISDN